MANKDSSGGGDVGRERASTDDLAPQPRPADPKPGIAVDDMWAPEYFLKPRHRRRGPRRAALAAAALCGLALAIVTVASMSTGDEEQPMAIATAPSGERGERADAGPGASAERSRVRADPERDGARTVARERRKASAAQAAASARRARAAKRSQRARRKAAAAKRRPAPAPPLAASVPVAPAPPPVAAAPAPAAAAPPPAAAAPPPVAAPPPPPAASIPCEFPPC